MKYCCDNTVCNVFNFGPFAFGVLISSLALWNVLVTHNIFLRVDEMSDVGYAGVFDGVNYGAMAPRFLEAGSGVVEPVVQGIDDSSLRGNADYQKWKTVFLGTNSGRTLWGKYNGDQNFRLNIMMGGNSGGDQGATTKDFVFNRSGKLTGATIVVGPEFAKNAPTRAPYPVTSYLTDAVTRAVRAAALLAHEFGHVEHARRIGGLLFQRQEELLDQNEAGYLKYGRSWFNRAEYQLIVSQLGASPVDIMRQREFIAEATAISYPCGKSV
jgi:hypothetical protein